MCSRRGQPFSLSERAPYSQLLCQLPLSNDVFCHYRCNCHKFRSAYFQSFEVMRQIGTVAPCLILLMVSTEIWGEFIFWNSSRILCAQQCYVTSRKGKTWSFVALFHYLTGWRWKMTFGLLTGVQQHVFIVWATASVKTKALEVMRAGHVPETITSIQLTLKSCYKPHQSNAQWTCVNCTFDRTWCPFWIIDLWRFFSLLALGLAEMNGAVG